VGRRDGIRRDGILRLVMISGAAISAALVLQVMSLADTPAAAPLQQIDKDSSTTEDGEKLVNGSDCSSCHALDRQVVGPAYAAVAKRYAGQDDALDKLASRIREGGSGNWGAVAMPSHKNVTDAQGREMVKWVLSLKPAAAPERRSETKLYSHTLKDGKTVQLDFPLFVEGASPKVTKAVFRGYELFNSYCYRCHGQDATGGQLAPDLRRSLNAGMSPREFLAAAMAGKKEKGMPSWAGFLSEAEVNQIYQYAKGRSLELVPSGRPPSEAD
jgi:cytochrome c